MYIEIHHNTDDVLNDIDKGVLRSLLGDEAKSGPAPEAKATPAKKATPAPAKKTAAAKPDPEPEEEAPADDSGDLRAEMTAKCTEMVSNGEAKKVKEALSSIGVKKISEVPDDKVADVIAALG